MPLTGAKFLGLTVADVTAQLAYGGSPGRLDVQLVRDRKAGDIPVPVPEGWPCYFELFGLRMWGLLQQWREVRSATGGLEVYQATLTDPREILSGAQVILADYGGSATVPNLINAYGWWEAQGYGASGATPAGMPYAALRTAILAIVNGTAGSYGGPLSYRGVTYGLDLSEVPTPPSFYRVGGEATSLLQLVDQVCADAGLDYWVELVGYVIRVRTRSLSVAQPLGTIRSLIDLNTAAGVVAQGSFGAEARNEPTSLFLVGGKRTTLHVATAFASFWGYNSAGQPIVGAPFVHENYAAVVESMTLFAPGLADLLGSDQYPTNTLEMRAAMDGPDSWEAYVARYNPAVAALVCVFFDAEAAAENDNVDGLPDELLRDDAEAMELLADDEFIDNFDRIYGFVKAVADRYYGRQFLVRIPFVLSATDPDSLQVTYSAEPCEAGYLAQGAAALGISPLGEEVLLNSDERILPFAYWEDGVTLISTRDDPDTVNEGLRTWQRTRQANRIIFLPGGVPVPCVHVELADPLFERSLDEYGGVPAVGPLVMADPQGLQKQRQNKEGGVLEIGLHPQARYPTSFGVPLRSNTEVYGPWYAGGPDGGVRYETDPGLTPWDCGGWAVMERIAAARVASAAAGVQVVEAGDMTVVGPPAYSLGDVLAAGGPNLTGVEVRFGVAGATVGYRWSTFTPRAGGTLNRQYEERLRRQAAAGVELRRNVRRALNRGAAGLQVAVNRSRERPLQKLPKYLQKGLAQSVIAARATADGRVVIGMHDVKSAMAASNPTKEGAENAAMVSLDGLLKPYTFDAASTGHLTKAPTPQSLAAAMGAVTSSSYHPFSGAHGVTLVTSRSPSGYSGVFTAAGGADAGTVRAVGLRAPVWLVGRGPNVSGTVTGVAGPLDVTWDPYRAVWSSRDLMTATVPSGQTLAASGTGYVWVGGNSGWRVNAYNPWRAAVPATPQSGSYQVVVGYCLNDNRWNVIAADCVS